MDANILQKGIGYTKTSVCEYIARMNEEFSQKLTESMKDAEKKQRVLEQRIAELEKGQNSAAERHRSETVEVLAGARRLAEQLKAQAIKENEKYRAELYAKTAEDARRVRERSQQVDAVLRSVRATLAGFEEELAHGSDKLSAQAQELSGTSSHAAN